MIEANPVQLLHHPASPPSAGREAFAVTVFPLVGPNSAFLQLNYLIEGPLELLKIPAPATPLPADRLWMHTCCEVFLQERANYYREYNFSPTGQWAAYAFSGYRTQLPNRRLPMPQMEWKASNDALRLEVFLPLADIQGDQGYLPLSFPVVLEETDGNLSYWAIRHPLTHPDFHHPDSFAYMFALDDLNSR